MLDHAFQVSLSAALVFDVDQIVVAIADGRWWATELFGAGEQLRIFEILLAELGHFGFDSRVDVVHNELVFGVGLIFDTLCSWSRSGQDPTVAEGPGEFFVQWLFVAVGIDRVVVLIVVPSSQQSVGIAFKLRMTRDIDRNVRVYDVAGRVGTIHDS